MNPRSEPDVERDEERRDALDAYAEALKWNLPENLVPGLLQSRGETTVMLEDATNEELSTAWNDLETALHSDTKRLGRSKPWAILWHMAQIAERLDDPERELETLEKAAKVAMAIIRLNMDEYELEIRSAPMVPLFDTLANRYVHAKKATEGLSASEALRAATVRVHTALGRRSEERRGGRPPTVAGEIHAKSA